MWSSRVNNAPYLDMRKEETESSRSCSIVALLLGSAVLWRIKNMFAEEGDFVISRVGSQTN